VRAELSSKCAALECQVLENELMLGDMKKGVAIVRLLGCVLLFVCCLVRMRNFLEATLSTAAIDC